MSGTTKIYFIQNVPLRLRTVKYVCFALTSLLQRFFDLPQMSGFYSTGKAEISFSKDKVV